MNPGKNRKLTESLDALEVHGLNLQTLARLLGYCGDIEDGAAVDAETVGRAGYLLTRELKQMNDALERLRKEIRRR
jgi:hypothetical protein